jgi:hypothetical protein
MRGLQKVGDSGEPKIAFKTAHFNHMPPIGLYNIGVMR